MALNGQKCPNALVWGYPSVLDKSFLETFSQVRLEVTVTITVKRVKKCVGNTPSLLLLILCLLSVSLIAH